MLKDYVKFGLMHWGSDAQGVENTRRFLLEWLSFLCRYVPVGLLERLPARLNDRPPIYHGRSDLETLMVSDLLFTVTFNANLAHNLTRSP